MAVELICGTTTEGVSNNISSNWYLGRFQATASVNGVTQFRVYSLASGNAKVNVYADNEGEPGSRIAYNDSNQAVSIGWNTLTVSSHNVTSGNYYWLGANCDTNGATSRSTGTNGRYKSATYSTFTAPDPAGTGFSTLTYLFSYALWGETGTPTPSITSISDTTLDDEQTGITIVCENASASGNTVHINSASDGSGTDVEQTITSESATEIVFTVGFGALTAGTAYLAIEDASTNYSTWNEITLNAGGTFTFAGATGYLDESGIIIANDKFDSSMIGNNINIMDTGTTHTIIFADSDMLIVLPEIESDDNIISLI